MNNIEIKGENNNESKQRLDKNIGYIKIIWFKF